MRPAYIGFMNMQCRNKVFQRVQNVNLDELKIMINCVWISKELNRNRGIVLQIITKDLRIFFSIEPAKISR